MIADARIEEAAYFAAATTKTASRAVAFSNQTDVSRYLHGHVNATLIT
ncbi:MAG: hypothetical protein L0219_17875 [Phycisphaerales bacterium]|nr:hypothetical protein [Phycisphaerales bacterium]